jgi:hypothetical protein
MRMGDKPPPFSCRITSKFENHCYKQNNSDSQNLKEF